MPALVARRVGWSVLILLLASIVMFVFVRQTTDPLAHLRTSIGTGQDDTGGDVRFAFDRERQRLGLDRPLGAQYTSWLARFVRGDWGESSVTHRSVSAEIGQRLWNTTQLVVWAMVLSVAVALIVGVVSATFRGSLVDHGLTGLAFACVSMPPFWFALMAIEWLVFVPKRVFHLAEPLVFSVGAHSATGGVLLDYPRHLVLPVLTLSLPLTAEWSRFVRTSMLEELSAPYIRTARGAGLSRRRVLVRHALRNALIPFTTVSALAIGHLFGGVIVTETIFAWPGMGQLLYSSLLAGDTAVLLPWLVVAATFVLALNFAADLLYAVLDPRIRN